MKNTLTFIAAIIAGLITYPAHAAPVVPATPSTVNLLFAGDIVLDGEPGKQIEQGHDPFAAFSDIINRADIRLGNLECVIATVGDPEDKNYNFRAHPRTLPILKNHFDAVSIANNHSGDFGRPAFVEMLALLDQSGIKHFGGGHDLSEAHTPLIIHKNGLTIALLGYNEFMPRSFEADVHGAGTAWSEDEQVVADIKKARDFYKADLVIPVMHWGWENEPHSSPRQQYLAHLMIDAGADLVIGGHPHVTEEIAYYHGKLIVYSVGNFMIDALDNKQQTIGWVMNFELDRNGVKSWHSSVANIDALGIPTPAPQELSPCGNRESTLPALCKSE